MPRPTIARDVVFVILCGEHEGWPVDCDGNPRVPVGLDAGVAGGYLLELAITRSIEVQAGKVVALDGKPPVDADLAALLHEIAAEQRPRSVGWWIERIAARKPHLRQLQILRTYRLAAEYDKPVHGWFGKRTERRCFAPDWGSEAWIMEKLQGALTGEVTDDRIVGLLGILCAGGWHGWFTTKGAESTRRAEHMARNHWIGREVSHFVGMQTLPTFT
jgi:hypothetical protein